MNGQNNASIKLYLPKQMVGWIWPLGCVLLIPVEKKKENKRKEDYSK